MFLTGTDEHGAQDPARRRGAGHHPASRWPTARARGSGRSWQLLDITNDDFIRTTEPRHERAVQEFLQGVYDNGDIELDTYEGLYCVACEALLHRGRARRRPCARSTAPPVEQVTEENYFFRLSRFEDRLLDHYEATPRRCSRRASRNEVLGFISRACSTSR